MRIDRLELSDYRNIGQALLLPHPNVNIIYGKNAQGKTNLLESIWLCSGNKSFRGAKESQMIQFEKPIFQIGLTFFDRERTQQIRYLAGEKRKILLNGVPLKSLSELSGEFYCVVFNPDDLGHCKGWPILPAAVFRHCYQPDQTHLREISESIRKHFRAAKRPSQGNPKAELSRRYAGNLGRAACKAWNHPIDFSKGLSGKVEGSGAKNLFRFQRRKRTNRDGIPVYNLSK